MQKLIFLIPNLLYIFSWLCRLLMVPMHANAATRKLKKLNMFYCSVND